MKAKAPANIAFIKYWGKRDEELRLPANSSISMNLSQMFTTTEVKFYPTLKADVVRINGKLARDTEKERVVEHLDRVREMAGFKTKASVTSDNNFPKGTGIASSASGFAALSLAATKAAGLDLTERELSILARLGSGSACRSIPDGFVEWKEGKTSESSYAHTLYPPNYWDIRDVVAIVGEKSKKVSSTEGHAVAESSSFFKSRIRDMKRKVRDIKKAFENKDFTKLGEITEAEAVNMHAVMMTSNPPLYYWLPQTLEIMLAVQKWRDRGLEAYFTVDAGPNVHVICQGKDCDKVKRKLSRILGAGSIIVNKPANGACLV